MAFSKWICTKSTKNMFVKIVYPGGHVELHEMPILAADIIVRNPRCVVAHPHVFRQPWAIVAPETVLMPGNKFYVVPVNTIRKLQRLSNKYHSPSPALQSPASQSQKSEEQDLDTTTDNSIGCWFFMNKTKTACSSISHNSDDIVKDGSVLSDKNCYTCTTNEKAYGDDSGDKTRSPSNLISPGGQTRGHTRKRIRGHPKGSPKRHIAAFDQWQPSLESINETDE
ncbi:hypothetical protein PTKIN_Ptkin13bG0142600 [Pterospermum kingtungense]